MGVHVDVRPVHLCILASNIKHLVHSIMYMLLVVYYKESGILILDSTMSHDSKWVETVKFKSQYAAYIIIGSMHLSF